MTTQTDTPMSSYDLEWAAAVANGTTHHLVSRAKREGLLVLKGYRWELSAKGRQALAAAKEEAR